LSQFNEINYYSTDLTLTAVLSPSSTTPALALAQIAIFHIELLLLENEVQMWMLPL